MAKIGQNVSEKVSVESSFLDNNNDVVPLLKLSKNSVHRRTDTGAIACGREDLIPVQTVQRSLTRPADTSGE